MIIEKQLYTVDDVWEMAQDPANEHVFIELIDGELITMTRPGNSHGLLATELAVYLRLFNMTHKLGQVTVESGYHPPGYRFTLLGPDVAFTRYENMPERSPIPYVATMPDLAVEILSPSDTLAAARRKTEVYLLNGTALVWLVQPEKRSVEVCRLANSTNLQIELVDIDGTLSGEDILPSFELEVSKIFAVLRD
jgi:Uma2 family endonuclease